MRRRAFISLLGGAAAVTWPLAARAQQQAMPVIGFLNSGSAPAQVLVAAAFRQGLSQYGFVDGRNLTIEYCWADGQYDRLTGLAADLVGHHVAAIMAGGPPAARAAKAATSTIPVVFTSGDDPVTAGFVASMNRPGGNVTGVHILFTELETKKLGLLGELIPRTAVIAALLNPKFPSIDTQTRQLQAAAHALGQPIQVFTAGSERELDAAFGSMVRLGVGALLVGADPFFNSKRDQIVALAARYAIPAVYEQRAFAEVGGLMSYGTNIVEGYRQAGIYTGRILKGARPADLPVVQLSKFELIINLKTAKELSLTIPPGVLAIAEEVIE
jgi:putative tryptophan/tyrosine transport system substrate-binding protein